MKTISIANFETVSGFTCDIIKLSYEQFGPPLGEAEVILVNHALTGNANVSGDKGWWNKIVGPKCAIDTNIYTVLCFDIPGNGALDFEIENYKDWTAKDIAEIYLIALRELDIAHLFALVGVSLGGGIAWEMLALEPRLVKHFIPVASDWKARDWLIANCKIQEAILHSSPNPIHDARMHAMLCYRTPEGVDRKFGERRVEDKGVFEVESWLDYHGESLEKRFSLSSYKLMNQLLRTVDINLAGNNLKRLMEVSDSNIHIVAVDSDLFYPASNSRKTYATAKKTGISAFYHEINSPDGHDAFLIEHQQLTEILSPIFK
jgi:homoserine O-acetyltransferase